MSEQEDKNKKSYVADLRNSFFTGLVLITPAFVTVWILNIIFRFLDGILGPVIYPPIEHIFGVKIPGLGLILTLMLVIGIGLLARNILGKSILKYIESVFEKLPLVKSIYVSAKQIIKSISFSGKTAAFKKVVMAEWPSKGLQTIGFVMYEGDTGITYGGKELDKDMVIVFFPTVPNPTTGFFSLYHKNDVKYLDISVEQAMKMFMSAGFLTPGAEKKQNIAQMMDNEQDKHRK